MDGSILDSLWSLVTPREARAEIVATPPAQQALQQITATNKAHQGQYLYDTYQRILDRAQAHPAKVNVAPREGLMQSSMKAAGFYYPKPPQIRYDPQVEPEDLEQTLPHEMLHFLSEQTTKVPGEVEHALMRKLLGSDTTFLPQAAYQPGAFSPVEHSIINEWFGGPRDWPR